ncbi:ankyrin repeat-containing domain protein [Cubamyces lactineus]|nr:ankyrin repeat-containing domain protein [Cubamyces lactineus]
MATNSIHNAALNRQFGLVRSLVSQDPKLVNAIDEDGRTPLHWAASSGSVDIARYLIDQGADVNRGDSGGWSPLHIACMCLYYCYVFLAYLQTTKLLSIRWL